MLRIDPGIAIRLQPRYRGQFARTRGDHRRLCYTSNAMYGSRLTRRTLRFVVRVVRGRAAGIDVRGVADARSTLANASNDDRELRQNRQ